jgi:hypothetical protein
MQTWKKRQVDSNLVDPSICPDARIKAKISGQKNSNSREGKKHWKNCDDALNFEESSILEQQ